VRRALALVRAAKTSSTYVWWWPWSSQVHASQADDATGVSAPCSSPVHAIDLRAHSELHGTVRKTDSMVVPLGAKSSDGRVEGWCVASAHTKPRHIVVEQDRGGEAFAVARVASRRARLAAGRHIDYDRAVARVQDGGHQYGQRASPTHLV
jgi:hypothetical protein